MDALLEKITNCGSMSTAEVHALAARRQLSPVDVHRVVLMNDEELDEFLYSRDAADICSLPDAVVTRMSISSSISHEFLHLVCSRVNWTAVSIHNVMNADDVYCLQDFLDWSAICRHQVLKTSVIAAHASRVDWTAVSRYQVLPVKFLRRHADRVDWREVSKYQNLPSASLWEFRDRVHWRRVAIYQHMTSKIVRRSMDRFDWSNGLESTGLLKNERFVIGPELFADMVLGGYTTLDDILEIDYTPGQVRAVLRLVIK